MLTLKTAPLTLEAMPKTFPYCQEVEVCFYRSYYTDRSYFIGCDENGINQDTMRVFLKDVCGAYVDEDVPIEELDEYSLGGDYYVTYKVTGLSEGAIYSAVDSAIVALRLYAPEKCYFPPIK